MMRPRIGLDRILRVPFPKEEVDLVLTVLVPQTRIGMSGPGPKRLGDRNQDGATHLDVALLVLSSQTQWLIISVESATSATGSVKD